jgi:hypothetical protein
MPELPDWPDMDQLRRQARELHRAAAVGAPDALTRVRAVSDRIALSAAQLAVAREYGCSSWPALRAEVARRRARPPTASQQSAAGYVRSSSGWLDVPYSFGGGASIQTAAGVVSPDLLTVGFGQAVLHASGVFYANVPSRRLLRRSRPEQWPRFDDLTATDDKAATYTLRFESGSLHPARPGEGPRRSVASLSVEPVPPVDTSWIELRSQNGSATRLVPSPRATVSVSDVSAVSADVAMQHRLEELAYWLLRLRHSNPSDDLSRERAEALARSAEIQQSGEPGSAAELPGQLARLCDCLTDQPLPDDLPSRWHRFLDAADQADGPQRHLDIAATLPQLDGLDVRLDHLVSGADSWRLYLRAKPTWWGGSEDGHRKWPLATVRADDDQGGRYLSTFGGSSGHRDHEELALEFMPRIDPLARNLKLTFDAPAAEAAADLDLVSAAA